MSYHGSNITEQVNPGSEKNSRLQVFYQEDQSGYPFVRVTEVNYEYEKLEGTGTELVKWLKENRPAKVCKEKQHFYLSAQEAREIAVELLQAAEYVDDSSKP